MRGKLARVGLIDKQETAKLAPFIEQHIASRKNIKPASLEVWGQGKRGLIEFFGSDSVMRKITAGEADCYKESLIGEGLAPMTIRKRLQFAKTIFRAALRHKLIIENPFSDVSIVATMPDRSHFVSLTDTVQLLDAAPDVDWRAIIALSRYGGMRCPSEVLSLRWEDIDWKRGRIIVTSPKTERYADKGTRIIPLFPELVPILTEAFELAPEGAVYVVNERFRKAANGPKGWRNCNLRTTFLRIVKRAGLKPWPRLFHNMRTSRETELMSDFPMHVVVAWLGHSIDIAKQHYCQVTDDHFTLANALQQAHAQRRSGSHEESDECKIPLVLPAPATQCDAVQKPEADGLGFEPRVPLQVQQFSRLPPSTTRPPIRRLFYRCYFIFQPTLCMAFGKFDTRFDTY